MRALRCLGVWLGATAGLAVVWRLVLPVLSAAGERPQAGGPPVALPFALLLEWLCAAALAGCALWFWLVTTVLVAAAARGRLPARIPACPAALRRALLAGCGLAVAGGLALPAVADEPFRQPDRPETGGRSVADGRGGQPGLRLLEGLRLPDRVEGRLAGSRPAPSGAGVDAGPAASHPAGTRGPRPAPVLADLARPAPVLADVARPAPGRPPAGPPGVTAARVVVVRPGDTLWELTAAVLPSGASDAVIADRWPHLYRLNRTVIGADPDLIFPGQRLRLPGA